MTECWINVYKLYSGKVWYGRYSYVKVLSEALARQAGSSLLYRIHVRMK